MLAAGCTAEQIGAAVKAALTIDDESQAERREKDRIRKREQRERENANKNNDSVHDVTRTRADIADPSPEGFLSPEPPILPNPQPVPPSPPKGGSSPTDFAEFWALFPNKVGKRDAEKAFVKASNRADLQAILAGLRLYAAKTDDRPWCNPATWLNQDRWEDAPAAQPQRQSTSPPRKRTPFDDLAEIERAKGWTYEPGSLSRSDENDQRVSAVERGHPSSVVDLRRGYDWHPGRGDH
jgi:hypothetical protein